MVLLTTTPRILHAISALGVSDTKALKDEDLPKSTTEPISHSALVAITRLLCPRTSDCSRQESTLDQLPTDYTLSALLRGTKPYFPPPPPSLPKSPSYEALSTRLLAAQEARQYNSLLNTSNHHVSDPLTQQYEDEEEDNISPSLVLNILLSIVLCAIAVFYATRFWHNDGLRVLASLGTAVVVGVAETGVYAAYLSKVKEARIRERKRRERKGFVREVQLGADVDADAVEMIGEGEKIWGKGVNGGVRRRVKEKWEREKQKQEEENESAKAGKEL